MERLTERIERAPECPSGYVIAKNDRYIEAIELLADYEDTGYTPEEIKALNTENGQLITNAARYVTRLFFETEKSEKLKAENERLQADCATMREAMEEFCVRVEKGEIRSRRTYSKFMELLRSTIHYKAVR